MIEAISIVVPAHDEEDQLAACLASLRLAARHPALAEVSVRIAVVLDRCSDQSGERAAPLLRRDDLIVELRDGNVGIARRAGIDALRAAESGRAPASVWLATTDADSRVPRDWLVHQLRLANAGADAIAGTIAVDSWEQQPAGSARTFVARYASAIEGAAHRHVHGANLGVRGSTYDLAGGMAGLPLGEDHALISVLEAVGASIVRPRALTVLTSGRREGRAPGGFSTYLRKLPTPP